MLFKPELIEKVLTGAKTQTRRPIKQGDVRLFDDDTNDFYVLRNWRLHWRTGRTYAICPGRGKPQVARIRLLDIRREDARNISYEDAVAEGFVNEPAFLEVWCGFYDQHSFKDIFTPWHLHSWQILKGRPDHLYAAWALTFELVQ